MTPLSVVIITFNEEHNITRCLESIKDIADEIVVVDSFSRDRTKEICLSYGVKFIEHPFEGHIEQKNFAITQATHPFILSLDADEAPDEKLRRSILEVKSNKKCDGYKMNRLTNYCGKWIRHSGWYPDTKLRLWDSRKGAWTGINPHDRYEMEEDSKICFLKGDILHYSYYSIDQHYKQLRYFSDIGAKALFNKKKKATIVKRFLSPAFKFVKNYFFKLGFLDGYYGFTVCRLSAYETYLKYRKLKDLESQS